MPSNQWAGKARKQQHKSVWQESNGRESAVTTALSAQMAGGRCRERELDRELYCNPGSFSTVNVYGDNVRKQTKQAQALGP